MPDLKINGLLLSPLKQILDERGGVYHYLKSSSPSYNGFGEAYYSKVNEGIVKGWKFHKRITQNFCVPFGKIRIVVFDNRPNSRSRGQTDEIILDDDRNYNLLSMPAELWYGFKCESNGHAILANITDLPHSPDESVSLPLINKEIPYEWK